MVSTNRQIILKLSSLLYSSFFPTILFPFISHFQIHIIQKKGGRKIKVSNAALLRIPIKGLSCCCLVTKLCLTLMTLWTVARQAPSVHGISQARILEWVAISFSRGSSWPRDQTHVSCIGRGILYHWANREAQKGSDRKPHKAYRVSMIPQ